MEITELTLCSHQSNIQTKEGTETTFLTISDGKWQPGFIHHRRLVDVGDICRSNTMSSSCRNFASLNVILETHMLPVVGTMDGKLGVQNWSG